MFVYSLYFLMELYPGGDLLKLIRERKNSEQRFTDSQIRFYVANVVQAVDYLHSHGIVYRDLKPENLMLASNGYR